MKNSKNIVLHVRPRSTEGKKNNALRKSGVVPANIYGLGKKSDAVEVELSTFRKVTQGQSDNALIYLQIGEGEQVPTLMSEVQADALTGQPIHIAFKRVNLNVKVTAEIPVELVGEFVLQDATALLTRNVIEVEALPADLPEKFEIDVTNLKEIGQTITIADLNFDRSKVTLQLEEEEMESPLVIVQEVKEEVEVAPTPAEGEAAAEGATPEAATDAAPAEEAKE